MRGYLNLYVAIVLLPAFSIAQVTIDGYAYLENQSDHSEIQVLFEKTVPSSLTDTTYTNENGYYINDDGAVKVRISSGNNHHRPWHSPLFICYMPLSQKTGEEGSLIGQKGDLGVNWGVMYYILNNSLFRNLRSK